MKKGDFLIIALVVLIIIISFIPVLSLEKTAENTSLVIKVDGKIYKEIKLRDNYSNNIEIKTKFGYNKIGISGKKVKMLEASCDDLLCVKEGEISAPYSSIICLPNRLIVYIKGDTKLDYLSY